MDYLVDAELTAQLHLSITSSGQNTTLKTLILRNNGGVTLFTLYHIAFRQGDIDHDTVRSQTMELYRHLTDVSTEGIVGNNCWEGTNLDGVALDLTLAGKRYLLSNIGGKGIDTLTVALVHGSKALVAGGLRTRQCTVSSQLGIDDGVLLRLRQFL